MSLLLSASAAAKLKATGVKQNQVFLQGWIHSSLSVNSEIRKANDLSSRSREAVIYSWPTSPACTKSSRTHALIQLAGISTQPPLSSSGVWESGMLSLIISQSSGKPELIWMTTSQQLWIPKLLAGGVIFRNREECTVVGEALAVVSECTTKHSHWWS